MSDYTLTPDDEAHITHAHHNAPFNWAVSKEKHGAFAVGDVLVKYQREYDWHTSKESWIKILVSEKSKVPRRFKVVYLDKYDVPWVKPMIANGATLGKDLICLASFSSDNAYFEVDPHYADHLILADAAAKFDDLKEFKENKKHRAEIRKHNRSIREKIDTIHQANEFIMQLNIGDIVWIADDDQDSHKMLYTVNEVIKEKVASPMDLWLDIDVLKAAGHTVAYGFRADRHYPDGSKVREFTMGTTVLMRSYVYKRQPKTYERDV